jgi:hypothetical protein
MFTEVAKAWEWLCELFEPNILSFIVQTEYEKCPNQLSPKEWYISFLILKAEVFSENNIKLSKKSVCIVNVNFSKIVAFKGGDQIIF